MGTRHPGVPIPSLGGEGSPDALLGWRHLHGGGSGGLHRAGQILPLVCSLAPAPGIPACARETFPPPGPGRRATGDAGQSRSGESSSTGELPVREMLPSHAGHVPAPVSRDDPASANAVLGHVPHCRDSGVQGQRSAGPGRCPSGVCVCSPGLLARLIPGHEEKPEGAATSAAGLELVPCWEVTLPVWL